MLKTNAVLTISALSLVILINCAGGASRGAYRDTWANYDKYSRSNPMVGEQQDNDSLYTPKSGFCAPQDLVLFTCQ